MAIESINPATGERRRVYVPSPAVEVDRLLAERHSTNEALDDAVQALRARQVPDVARSADKLTRLLAPTQALQPEGEFYGFLHHENRVPHDLPKSGGAQ